MEHHIGCMHDTGVGTEKMKLNHIGEPHHGLPCAFINGGKCPFDFGKAYFPLYIRVVDDIENIIVFYEAVLEGLKVNDQDGNK